MAVENGRGPANGGSIKYAAGLAIGVLAVAATISAGIGRYSGRDGAQEVITPEIERFDAKVNAARLESEQRRMEIREEFGERRRELEARLQAELGRLNELHMKYQAETKEALEGKADEEQHREALEHLNEEISRIRDRLERIEALVYGRSGGAR
jgi:chromosome segregation ATPase